MIIVGLLLVLAVVGVTLAVLMTGNDPVQLELHWSTVHTTGRALFVTGAATLLVAVLAAFLLRAGLRRSRRRRREMKELRSRAASGPGVTPPAAPPSRPSPGPGDADSSFDTAPRD